MPLSLEARQRLTESIHESAEKLRRISDAYNRCVQIASGPAGGDASDAFLQLIESAGSLTSMHLAQLGSLLDMLERVKEHAPEVAYDPVRSRTLFKGTF